MVTPRLKILMRTLHTGSQKQILLLDYRNEVTVEVSQVSMQGLKSPPDQSFALFIYGRQSGTGEARPDTDFSDLSRFQG